MEDYIYSFVFLTECSVKDEGNLILLKLPTASVIAPAANLPLVSLTSLANLLPVSPRSVQISRKM